ncbi:hypothetical protein AHAS_Ahas05G0102000 [Arachis hypogaea]
MERQFQQEYTTSMFRNVQNEFVQKVDCRVSIVAEEGESICMKVEEEKLVNDTIICVPYDVYFDRSTEVYKVPTYYVLPRWSKNIKHKHTYVKSSYDVSRSDESHTAFRGLCAYFFNIPQEFVNEDDETVLLHAALEEIRAKLTKHCAKKRSKGVAATYDSIGSQSSSVVGLDNIQEPSKVTTKDQPKSKRLDAALEKSFKKSAWRKNKNAALVVHSEGSGNIEFSAPVCRNEPQQFSGFMSLLSSFGNS